MSWESRILYHYTSEINLGPIVKSQMIDLTGSNVNHIPVVWMTSNPSPEDLGIGVRGGLPTELDKTRYRITIQWEPHFKKWTQWCKEYGVPKELMDALAESAGKTDTHESWYISEEPVLMKSWLSIDNLVTRKHLWDPSHRRHKNSK